MKKIFAIVFAALIVFVLCACGYVDGTQQVVNPTADTISVSEEEDETGSTKHIKVGMVCIGDENDQGYTYNFIQSSRKASVILAEDGIDVEWVFKYNLVEGDPVAEANEELADDGCSIVINNSYGQEPAMLSVAGNYPDTIFVGATNEGSWKDNLPNTVNAFARIHEGRYVAGVVAGLKLQEMIDNGEIGKDEAEIGYVGAYSFNEVISGMTAYYLGAKSVCPSVTMKVQFVGSWSDATQEANAAQSLCDIGCKIISQHSDNTTPATTAEKNGVFHTGYNADMVGAAPKASLISTKIDWTNYFVNIIRAYMNGEEIPQDYSKGFADGEVVMTELNTDICAKDTEQKINSVIEDIVNGRLNVFDISSFTVNGDSVLQAFAVDTNCDFTPDSGEAIYDGYFHESEVPGLQSAPYFGLRIDGIEWLNEAY